MDFMYLGHTKLLVKICKYMCALCEQGNLIRLKGPESQRGYEAPTWPSAQVPEEALSFMETIKALMGWNLSKCGVTEKEQLQYRIKAENILSIWHHVKEEVNRGTCSNATVDTGYFRKRLRCKKVAKDRQFQEKVLNRLKHCVSVRQT